MIPKESGPLKDMKLALQERLSRYMEENPCSGPGDIRGDMALEVFQRCESHDYWMIPFELEGKTKKRKMYRSDVMALLLDMVSSGISLPKCLSLPGFPKGITVMNWLSTYKPFRELMDTANEFYALVKADEAEDIIDGNDDPKQAFRDNARANLRLKLAESFNSKRFGRRQQIDVNHHDDLDPEQLTSRFKSVLVANRKLIEEKLGIQIIVPNLDPPVISVRNESEEVIDVDPSEEGFEGQIEKDEWEDPPFDEE